MTVAGLVVHRKHGFFITKEGYEYVLVISLVATGVSAIGPGRWSLDSGSVRLARRHWLGWAGALGGAGLRGRVWPPGRVLAAPEGGVTAPHGHGAGTTYRRHTPWATSVTGARADRRAV